MCVCVKDDSWPRRPSTTDKKQVEKVAFILIYNFKTWLQLSDWTMKAGDNSYFKRDGTRTTRKPDQLSSSHKQKNTRRSEIRQIGENTQVRTACPLCHWKQETDMEKRAKLN